MRPVPSPKYARPYAKALALLNVEKETFKIMTFKNNLLNAKREAVYKKNKLFQVMLYSYNIGRN